MAIDIQSDGESLKLLLVSSLEERNYMIIKHW